MKSYEHIKALYEIEPESRKRNFDHLPQREQKRSTKQKAVKKKQRERASWSIFHWLTKEVTGTLDMFQEFGLTFSSVLW